MSLPSGTDWWATVSGPCPVRARIAAAGLVLHTALTYAAGIQQELNGWESLADARVRPLPKAE